jgi:hypothetical protein
VAKVKQNSSYLDELLSTQMQKNSDANEIIDTVEEMI